MQWKSDPFWGEAFEAAKGLSPRHNFIVVPEEFYQYGQNFWPLGKAKQLAADEITAFAIVKDRCKCFQANFWRESSFRRFHCVFANEVFVVYSSFDEDRPQDEEQIAKHIPAFLEHRSQFLEIIGAGEREDLPYLLDTQKNRILKEMFPDHHYVTELFMDLSHEPAKLREAVFKYCVKAVTLEISGYCNRDCAYCPVSQIKVRKDKRRKISAELYERCVQDLKKVDYAGNFNFHMFNEPTYDRKLLLRCLHYVREHLPECHIIVTTNGDFLTADYLEELAATGVNELCISVHYSGKWNRGTQIAQIHSILDRIGIGARGDLTETDRRIIFNVDRNVYNSTTFHSLLLRTEDFEIHGMDRGGVLTDGVHRVHNLDYCLYSMENFNMAFEGAVLPCCALCCDAPGMEPWAYGNMQHYKDIFSAFTSEKAAAFRRRMFAPRTDDEHTPDPCKTCAIAYMDGEEKLYRMDDGYRREIYDCWFSKSKSGKAGT